MDDAPGIKTFRINLGLLGRSGNAASETTNAEVKAFIPQLERLFDTGKLRPLDYFLAGTGFENISDGIAAMREGRGKGRKVIVKLQDE